MAIRMAATMYKVLLHYNTQLLYKSDVWDAAFIKLMLTGFIQPKEIREGIQIAPDDARMKFMRGNNYESDQSFSRITNSILISYLFSFVPAPSSGRLGSDGMVRGSYLPD